MQTTKNQLKSYRRQVIIKLAQSGHYRQGQIGQIAGVSQGMVSKVLSGYRKQGLTILQMGSPKGAVAKLSVDQLAQLPALLAKGAISYGFQGELWTRKRVGYVIEQHFRVCYSERHVGRLLVKIGYSLQKPQLQDPKQCPLQVKQWQKEDLPALKKKAQLQQAKLYYQDEAGFYLLVSRQASWAPVGKTPVLQAPTHSPHLSVSVAISPEGELFYQLRESSFKGNGIVYFLKKFLKHKRKKVYLVWDSAKIHTGQAVKDFLSSLKKESIHLYHTPKYAPATNAAEQVWHYIKNVELANCVYKTIIALKTAVKAALEKLKTKPELIQRFFHHKQVAFYN